MKPMIDPKRNLKGATPETLARALLRPLRPRAGMEGGCQALVVVHEGEQKVVVLLWEHTL